MIVGINYTIDKILARIQITPPPYWLEIDGSGNQKQPPSRLAMEPNKPNFGPTPMT